MWNEQSPKVDIWVIHRDEGIQRPEYNVYLEKRVRNRYFRTDMHWGVRYGRYWRVLYPEKSLRSCLEELTSHGYVYFPQMSSTIHFSLDGWLDRVPLHPYVKLWEPNRGPYDW